MSPGKPRLSQGARKPQRETESLDSDSVPLVSGEFKMTTAPNKEKRSFKKKKKNPFTHVILLRDPKRLGLVCF